MAGPAGWAKLGSLRGLEGEDMRDRRPLFAVIAAVVVVAALAVAFALGAFKSDAERAHDCVQGLMESYVVPQPDEDGNEPEDSPWPAADYGDAATMQTLAAYGVDTDQWHRHCLGNLSFELGDASADGDSATVSVTVTNASLAAAVEAAGNDFEAFSETQDAEDLYAQGGRAVLFSHLVDSVYAHLDANESPVTTTVDVTCHRGEDGSWSPDVSGDEAFFSALYGGSDVVSGLAAAAEGE